MELAAVDELRAAGLAAAAIRVLEHAIGLIEGALGFVDDSDGEVGGVLDDAQQLHAQACIEAKPDPVELAEHLAHWALRSDWEVFLDSPGTHADALGESGLARFQEIVDDASVGLSVADEDEDEVEPSAFTIRYLQEQLAAQRGTDELIEVLAQDLSSAHQFHRIATILADDDRVEDALAWVDRGRNTTFDTWQDDRLDDLAADLHRRAGRFEVATQLVAEAFAASPTVAGYQRLRVFATGGGLGPPPPTDASVISADGFAELNEPPSAPNDISWMSEWQNSCGVGGPRAQSLSSCLASASNEFRVRAVPATIEQGTASDGKPVAEPTRASSLINSLDGRLR